ncbi:hypothetical protein HMI56_003382 [Coelomomyces lativittatus]|nr:hypothetical protein HMI56_003382 [Coelomomyces lativittatus]
MPSSMTSSKLSENTLELENGMYRISHLLTSYARNQKYYRTRENRNQDTVLTIQSRIGWFAFLESCLIVMMSLAQVYFVRAFFNVGSLKSKF